jgi:DNA-directed RNA polymerase specialized sigma subunit
MSRSRPFQKINQRTVTQEQPEQRIELLRNRVGLLKGRDRYLMEMYLENANTFRQMARVSGVNEANVARRIHKLVRRLLDGQYITCLRASTNLTDAEKEMARAYLVEGTPMRKIARRNGVSYYAVRTLIKKIQERTRV